MELYTQGMRYKEYRYERENELERDVVEHAKTFFGNASIYIDAKKKIQTRTNAGSIPDGFLFEFSDVNTPVFYLVEAELAKHDFYGHIFPQITKFISFFNYKKSQHDLIHKLYIFVLENEELKQQFDTFLKGKELYKTIKDTVENSQNVLIVIDDAKEEFEEVIETYFETWGNMVKILVLKKYKNGEEVIFSLNPTFEAVEYEAVPQIKPSKRGNQREYTEEGLLYRKDEQVKEIYQRIKEFLLVSYPYLEWKVTRNYISISKETRIAAFTFTKKVIKLTVMKKDTDVQPLLHHHEVKRLSEGMKEFWNSESCEISIHDDEHIDEIMNVLSLQVV